MNLTADVHTLVGAYVLDAVDPAETALVEEHLAACTSCTEDVASMRAVAVALAGDAAATPPAWLRERLVAEIARTPQLAPRPQLALPDLTPPAAPLPGPPAAPQPQPQPWIPLQVPVQQPGPVVDQIAARRRQPSRRPLVGLAAALAVVCLGLGFVITEQRGDLQAEQARVEALTGLTALTDAAFESSAAVPVEGGGEIAVVNAGDESLLVTRALPNLPPGKTYQVWLQDDTSTVRSVGLLGTSGNRQDERLVNLAGLSRKDVKLCITVEPEGGSTQPTTPILAAVDLNAGSPN
jgi:anti-sigma-K factor RskA